MSRSFATSLEMVEVATQQSDDDQILSGQGLEHYKDEERLDRWELVATRILFKPWYTVVCAVVFLLQISLFIWGMVHHEFLSNLREIDEWYIALDCIITVIMVAEVLVRMMATRKTFFNSKLNMLDFGVMMICTLALVLYFVDPETAVLGSLVLALRFLFQMIRMGILIKRARDRKRMMASSEAYVDFGMISPVVGQGTDPFAGGVGPVIDYDSYANEKAGSKQDKQPLRAEGPSAPSDETVS
jgi:hypothetical protein